MMGSESLAIASIFPIQICHSAALIIKPQFLVYFDCTFTHSLHESSSFTHLNYLSLQDMGTLHVLPSLFEDERYHLRMINSCSSMGLVKHLVLLLCNTNLHRTALLNNKASFLNTGSGLLSNFVSCLSPKN